MVFPLLLPVTAQYANYLPRPAPKGTRDPLPQAAFITPSEPARSVGGTRAARGVSPMAAWTRAPKAPEPSCFQEYCYSLLSHPPPERSEHNLFTQPAAKRRPLLLSEIPPTAAGASIITIIQKNISNFPLAISKLICYDNTVARNMRLGA